MKLKLCDSASQAGGLRSRRVAIFGRHLQRRRYPAAATYAHCSFGNDAHAFDIELGREDASNNIKKYHMPGTCSWTITFPILSPSSHVRFKLAKTSN